MTANETKKMHLRRFFPYLKNEYRKLNKKELRKKETLKELFGDAETNLEKLKVIFDYQNIL
jgi:pyruvate-formate lyase-activating enzyme